MHALSPTPADFAAFEAKCVQHNFDPSRIACLNDYSRVDYNPSTDGTDVQFFGKNADSLYRPSRAPKLIGEGESQGGSNIIGITGLMLDIDWATLDVGVALTAAEKNELRGMVAEGVLTIEVGSDQLYRDKIGAIMHEVQNANDSAEGNRSHGFKFPFLPVLPPNSTFKASAVFPASTLNKALPLILRAVCLTSVK